jgi:hypothetical protein
MVASAPRILIVFLLAPTVPSEPRPKKTALVVASGVMSSVGSYRMLEPPTSSVMPTVNRRRGCSRSSSSKIPATIPGVNSLDDRPYRPPTTRGSSGSSPSMCDSATAVATSRKSGSPLEPGSLVRSSTAIRRTVAGRASSSCRDGNGRNSLTCNTPTRSPRDTRVCTVSRAVSAPDPMRITTRSASGWPAYSTTE